MFKGFHLDFVWGQFSQITKYIFWTCPSNQPKAYSAGQKKRYEYCFMNQKCQIQNGMAWYKNAAIPIKTKGINTTHQHFQMRYVALFYLKRLKSYQPSNFECTVSIVEQTLF